MESIELSRLFVFVDERRRDRRERERESRSGVFMSDATFALSYEAGAVAEAGLDRRYRYPSADKMALLPYIPPHDSKNGFERIEIATCMYIYIYILRLVDQ